MNDIDKRIEAAEALGWYNCSACHRALGTVLGPAGFPPNGTIVQTLPTLERLQELKAQKSTAKRRSGLGTKPASD